MLAGGDFGGDADFELFVEAAQRVLAGAERGFGGALGADVDVGAEPLGDVAGRVTVGDDAGEKRAEHAVGPAQGEGHFERDALGRPSGSSSA